MATTRYVLLPAILLVIACAQLAAQPENRRATNADRARPRLEEDEAKKYIPPYILQVPSISDETRLFLNRNTINDGSTPSPQNESSIAISPVDPNFLLASAVDARGAYVYLSTNGGNSWANKSFGSVHTNWQTGNDPSVGFDYMGNGYVMYGAFPRPFTGESGVYIAKTTDKGLTWQSHIPVIEHVGEMTPDSAFEDKYYIQIDNSTESPYRGYMYTPWKRVTDRDSATQIVFTRSTDGGQTWAEPIPVSARKTGISTHITFGQSFPITTTGPDGNIYVAWNDGPARSIGFAKSIDGGLSFTDPTYPVVNYEYLGTERYLIDTFNLIDTVDLGGGMTRYDTTVAIDTTDKYHVLKKTFRAETYPTIMADNSSSTRRGWLYMAWAARENPDIFFIRSTDAGETWSSPVIITTDQTGHDQWWPWLSVDETNGDIAVMYSDSRNDPQNIMIDTYISYSSDGGTTWIDRRATDTMSDFRNNPFADQVFAGDYSGNAFRDGKVYPSFLDTREDNDVYTTIVNIRKPYPVENLKVGGNPANPLQSILTWTNPAKMETIFGKPIVDYGIVIHKDGGVIQTLPAGTVTFSEAGLVQDQQYNYDVYIAVGADTSVPRSVTFRAGGARLPAAPVVVDARGNRQTVELDVVLPGVRDDSVTVFANLKAYRAYRDGVLLWEREATSADTGAPLTITDTPEERGYYRYTFTALDDATPPNESPVSSPIDIYAGPLVLYGESFDAMAPRFLYTGIWATTTTIALTAPASLTDSPGRNYSGSQNSYTRIYPVELNTPVELRFSHIAIVDPGDAAMLEISYDDGSTWEQLRSYNVNNYTAWEDRSADPGDWLQEIVQLEHPSPVPGATGTIRFRLVTDQFTNRDGWYIDDILFTDMLTDVEQLLDGGTSVSVRPNPFGTATIIEYRLHAPARVSLKIYDAMGRAVRELVDEVQEEGAHAATFGAGNLPSGTYYYTLATGNGSRQGRIMLVR